MKLSVLLIMVLMPAFADGFAKPGDWYWENRTDNNVAFGNIVNLITAGQS
jgi:hypothetical protein